MGKWEGRSIGEVMMELERNESRGKRYLIGKAVSTNFNFRSYNGNPTC
jgi:hypothetical protein